MKYSIGIDFATCNTCINIFLNNKYITIKDQDLEFIPSCVYINNNNLYGKAALAYKHLPNYIHQFKRLIGKNQTEINNLQKQLGYQISIKNSNISIIIENIEYNLEDIITLYFNYLKTLIINQLAIINNNVYDINENPMVVTVPAYFNEYQRSVIIKSFNNIGLNYIYLLNEPTAAAFYYINHYNNIQNSYCIVFDIGGGTTDLTLLYVDTDTNIIQVICTLGDCNFGGQDFSKKLLIYVLKYLKDIINIQNIVNDNKLIDYILETCNSVKKELSCINNEEILINFYIHDKEYSIPIDNEIYKGLCSDLLKQCNNMFDKIIDNSNINIDLIKHVLLIGGPIKMPQLKENITNYFKNSNIYDDFDPKLIVSQGAALYNYYNHIKPKINNHISNDIVLVDVTPLALGIKTINGNCLLIEKNTNIPCTKFKTFSTYYDNQRIIDINIIQGYDNELTDYKIIGNIQLTNINAMPKKEPRIVVKFYIDKSGLLTVSVVEENSNVKNCLLLHV